MSAKKIEGIDGFTFQTPPTQTRVALAANDVRVHRNGIEFHSDKPVAVWKEIAVALESPMTIKKIHCTGVVVACSGNRHTGYNVSMLFTHISKHSQEMLSFLSSSRLN